MELSYSNRSVALRYRWVWLLLFAFFFFDAKNSLFVFSSSIFLRLTIISWSIETGVYDCWYSQIRANKGREKKDLIDYLPHKQLIGVYQSATSVLRV